MRGSLILIRWFVLRGCHEPADDGLLAALCDAGAAQQLTTPVEHDRIGGGIRRRLNFDLQAHTSHTSWVAHS